MNFRNNYLNGRILLGFLLLCLMGFILTVPTYAVTTNPCERCVRQCERQYEKNSDRCDLLGHGLAYAACIERAEEVYETCIEECFIEYDHDCDQYVNPGGGGGMGTCHYEVETGRCVPYAN